MYKCALCGIKACRDDLEKAPQDCPSLSDEISEVKELYTSDENYKIAKISTLISTLEDKTRIEETLEFVRQCGYAKIGLAFCNALAKETEMLDRIFNYHGYATESVMCKVGCLSKETVGLARSAVPMCNPISQAQFLNERKTDLNVVIGLCIGHDSLFIKYSDAPVTVFAVKDKVLAHNPLGAVYLAEGTYKSKLFPPK